MGPRARRGKTIAAWAVVAAYAAAASPGLFRPPLPRLRRAAQLASSWSKRGLRLFGVRTQVRGVCAGEDGAGILVVANHASYIDALVLAAIRPSLFVTSFDVGGVGLPGIITRLAGCIHVERRDRSRLRRDVEAVAARLAAGFAVVLFPEGTSTDGSRILAFKSSLIEPALLAECVIQPVCIEYLAVDGRPPDAATRDAVAFHGDMEFLPHFQRFLGLRTVDVRVTFLEPWIPTRDDDRKVVAGALRERILSCLRAGASDAPTAPS